MTWSLEVLLVNSDVGRLTSVKYCDWYGMSVQGYDTTCSKPLNDVGHVYILFPCSFQQRRKRLLVDQMKCVVLHEGRTCFIVGALERPENLSVQMLEIMRAIGEEM